MQEKFKGIVIKASDFKEADKLATIFSLENGIISAKFTGVKKDKAKFKAVARAFVFADFVINEKGQSITITQADILDDFGKILLDYSKTMCGYIVLDIVRSILPIQKPEEDIFLLSLTALKNIENSNEFVATIDYILKFFSFSGVQLVFPDTDLAYLDPISGNFTTQRVENALLIDKKVYAVLKSINCGNALDNLNSNILKQSLRLLHNIIYLKFGVDLKSFQFI